MKLTLLSSFIRRGDILFIFLNLDKLKSSSILLIIDSGLFIHREIKSIERSRLDGCIN